MTLLLGSGAVLLAALVKGAIGFGFPTLGTPLLSLVIEVKAAVVALIVPNIVLDGLQFLRRGAPLAIVQRFAGLLVAGAIGTVLGTRLLAAMPPDAALLVLGVFIVLFVGLNVAGIAPRVPSGWERWLSPLVGLLVGIIGGVTNVPGTPLVMYFHALALPKHDFVAAVAFTFVVYKLVQLAAVTFYGLLSWSLLVLSFALTAAALGGFALGLMVQDRLDQRTFNRMVLGVLATLGLWLVVRALW
jgi:uncharacterized membrane protein YfcA